MTEELKNLKQKATELGISFSGNIGVESLKEKIQEKEVKKPELNQRDLINKKRKKISELVRIRLTNLDPNDSELKGSYYTFSSVLLGTHKQLIPFGEEWYTNGYHVPRCILNILKKCTYTIVVDTKDDKGIINAAKSIIRNKFSIEELPTLTDKEMKKLAAAQQARGSIAQGAGE